MTRVDDVNNRKSVDRSRMTKISYRFMMSLWSFLSGVRPVLTDILTLCVGVAMDCSGCPYCRLRVLDDVGVTWLA